MQDRIEFREKLAAVEELAASRNKKLDLEDIKDVFNNMELDEGQLKLICEYLQSRKIQVEGYMPDKALPAESIPENEEIPESEDTPEESGLDFLEIYMEDIKGSAPVSEEEAAGLYQAALDGDDMAKSRLIEAHLLTVVEIAKKYMGGSLPVSDLIQEGNVGMMLGIDGLRGIKNEIREGRAMPEAFIKSSIAEAIENAIEEYDSFKSDNNRVLEKINYVSEAIRNISEETGAKVSIEEIAEYLEMKEEEIRDILRLASDDFEIDDGEQEEEDDTERA